MAIENNWRTPAGIKDEDYEIGVSAIAVMKEIEKGNIRETGKEARGKIYSRDNIRSDELEAGITITVETGSLEKGAEH